MTEGMFGNLVKPVVDVAQGVKEVGGEMHADEEALLLGEGSRQPGPWGINLYPAQFGTPRFIEFDSVIHIRPRQGAALARSMTRLCGRRSRRSSTD